MIPNKKIKNISFSSTTAMTVLFSAMSTISAAELEGYATLNGGTTGGQGGEVVYATTGTEIHEAMCNRASKDTPLIIYVTGTINHENTSRVKGNCSTSDDSIQFKKVSNISLIGTGSGALFDEIGIHLREASNIIIQNVHVRNVKKSGSPISNGGDSIGLEKNVSNVWIDHNELEASGGEKDGYDSLLDIKNGVKYVTVSYNHLHHSGRGGLIGFSDSDDANDFVTFHHNYYESIDSRMPLLRHATAHAYNNYYYDMLKSGMNPRIGGQIKAENNHFEKANNPIGTFYTDDMGFWDVSGNIFEDVTWNEMPDEHPAGINPISTTSINIPYDYTLHDASCVKDIVTSLAGNNSNLAVAGDDCKASGDTPVAESSINLQLSLKDNTMVQLDWAIENIDVAQLQVYRDTDSDPDGRVKIAGLNTDLTTYTDTSIVTGAEYFYWLKVRNADGDTFNSDAMGITVPEGNGHPVIDLNTSIQSDSSVQLSWTIENADVANIELYRDTDSTPSGRVRIATVPVTDTTYNDTDVSTGDTYYYWVKMTDTDGNVFNCAAASAQVE